MPNIGSPLIGGAYETHSAELGKGGLRTVADWTARNAIIEDRLEEGMQVYTVNDGITWQLKASYSVPTVDGDWEDVSDMQVGDGITITGAGTLLDPFVATSGVTEHQLLNNLNWASAGHTIDDDLEVNDNSVVLTEISTPSNPDADNLKIYAKDNGGVTKLYTLDSDGTEIEVGSGAGATELPDLSDVDAALDYTDHNVFQADGTKYTGATYSHTWLDDIGSYTHAELDSHVDTDVTAHAAATNLLHTTGAESKAGLLTFSDTLPQSAVVPSADDDLCNKAYIDSVATGLEVKASCVVATTAAGTLATDFENGDTIDTVTLATGNRILIKNQADATENGIYTVNASGAPTRATDYDESSEVQEGTFTSITGGSVNINKQFVQITKDPVLGADDLVFSQLSAAQVYTADGEGIEVAANQFSLELDGTTLSKSGSGVKLAAGFGTSNTLLGMDNAGTAQEYKTLSAGSNVTILHGTNAIEISASVSGIADYFYSQVVFHSHISSSYTWTNMPLVETALAIYKRADLTGAVEYRICAYQAVAGAAGADLNLQYSTNGVTWYACDTAGAGELDVGTGTGLKTGSWATLVAGAVQDVRLRLVGKGGNGVADPQWRELWVEFKYNASIADHSDSDTVNNEVTVHSHPASSLVWTNMPAALTEFLGSVYSRQRIDLTKSTHYRIYVNQAVAGLAGADINLQYSLDGTTWVAANSVVGAGELDVGTGTGIKVGAWAALKEAAMQDVYIRLVGKEGNGVVDPSWRQVKVQFREFTYGQGVTGSDTEILFNDGGATGTDADFVYNKTDNKLTVPSVDVDKISNLTDNGFVKTSSGDGTLSVDTVTYLTDISGQDLSTADNSTSQFITQGDIDWATNVPANETDPIVGAVTGIVMANGAGVISAAVAGTDYQAPLTADVDYLTPGTAGSTYSPIASPTFTTNITTPIVYGSAASGGDLTLYSTSHGTKGNIFFGTSTYDEVNNRLGIGTVTPTSKISIVSPSDAPTYSSLLITNPEFTGSATGWTLGGGGGTPDWYYDTDKVSHAAGAATAALEPSTPLTVAAGEYYLITVVTEGVTAGYINLSIGGATKLYSIDSSGTTVDLMGPTINTDNLKLTPAGTFVGSVTTVLAYRVTPVEPALTAYSNDLSSWADLRVTFADNLFIGQNSGIASKAQEDISTYGVRNIAIGKESLKTNSTGSKNIAIGVNSMQYGSKYDECIAIGYSALFSPVSIVSNSIAIGSYALNYCTGTSTIGIGYVAGQQSGSYNILIGNQTGSALRDKNVAIGYSCGFASGATDADENVYIGYYAGYSAKGSQNTFIGTQSGYSNLTGDANVLIGYKSGYNETGSDKLYIENSNSATPLIYGDFSSDYITINGGRKHKVTDLNAATLTLTSAHHIIQCRRTLTGTCAITLPSIAAVGGGTEYIIIDSGYMAGTNNITIVRDGADTITNVGADYVLNTNGSTFHLIANSVTSNWEII